MTLLKTFSVTAAFAVMTATSAAAASLLAFSEANNNGDTAGFNDATFTLTGTVNGANLSSTHEWDLVSYNDNGDGTADWSVSVKVTNNTVSDPLAPTNANRLLAWGFSTTPSATASSLSENGPDNWTIQNGFSTGIDGTTGLQSFDVCIEVGCTGGGSGTGVEDNGGMVTFGFVITSDVPSTEQGGLFISRYYNRYQTVGTDSTGYGGSAKLLGECSPNDPLCLPGTGPQVPVPAGLPLMLTAIGIGAYMRKRARKSA